MKAIGIVLPRCKWELTASFKRLLKMILRRHTIWLLLPWLSSAIAAQQPAVTIKANSRLVQVHVSVAKDKSGFIVGGLTAADFVVKDNGNLRQVTSLAQGEQRNPVQLLFLIESSRTQVNVVNSLPGVLPQALGSLRPADLVGIASVYPGHKILLEPTTVRTTLPAALEQLQRNQQAYLQTPESKTSRQFEDFSRALVDISNSKTSRSSLKGVQSVIVLVTDDFALLNLKVADDVTKALVKNGTLVAAFVDAQQGGLQSQTEIFM